MRRLLSVVLLLVCGCSTAGMSEAEFCARYRCETSVKFAPIPELAGVVTAITARAAKATARPDIGIAPDGIPVLYAEDLIGQDDEGNDVEACGITERARLGQGQLFAQAIYIDPTPPENCAPVWAQLMHECVHALAPDVPHAEAPSVFSPGVDGGHSYDERALVQLCSEFECKALRPETYAAWASP